VQLAVNVDDIDAAGAFSAVPAKRRPGYANFALDDPALKLVLIENPGSGGVDVVDVDGELHAGMNPPEAGGRASTAVDVCC